MLAMEPRQLISAWPRAARTVMVFCSDMALTSFARPSGSSGTWTSRRPAAGGLGCWRLEPAWVARDLPQPARSMRRHTRNTENPELSDPLRCQATRHQATQNELLMKTLMPLQLRTVSFLVAETAANDLPARD